MRFPIPHPGGHVVTIKDRKTTIMHRKEVGKGYLTKLWSKALATIIDFLKKILTHLYSFITHML